MGGQKSNGTCILDACGPAADVKMARTPLAFLISRVFNLLRTRLSFLLALAPIAVFINDH